MVPPAEQAASERVRDDQDDAADDERHRDNPVPTPDFSCPIEAELRAEAAEGSIPERETDVLRKDRVQDRDHQKGGSYRVAAEETDRCEEAGNRAGRDVPQTARDGPKSSR